MKKKFYLLFIFSIGLLSIAPITMAAQFYGEFQVTITEGDIAPIGSVFNGSFSFDDTNIVGGWEFVPLTSLDFEFDTFTFPIDLPSRRPDGLPWLQAAFVELMDGEFQCIVYAIANHEIPRGDYICVDWAGVTFQYCVQSELLGPVVGSAQGIVTYSALTEGMQILIDIKPGSYPNSINLKSNGKIPIAILTTDNFEVYDVNPISCMFAGAYPLRWNMEDVDDDGDDDMLIHFKTQELNLYVNSTEASIECETYDSIPIKGTDSVNIVPKCKSKNKKIK